MTRWDGCDVIDVLLVEDDPGDILMTKEAFEHYKIRNQLHVVTDGEQALDFLHQLSLIHISEPTIPYKIS